MVSVDNPNEVAVESLFSTKHPENSRHRRAPASPMAGINSQKIYNYSLKLQLVDGADLAAEKIHAVLGDGNGLLPA